MDNDRWKTEDVVVSFGYELWEEKMKKIAAIITLAALALCLFGCAETTETMAVGNVSVSYPNTWETKDISGGKMVGMTVSEAETASPNFDAQAVTVGIARVDPDKSMSAASLASMLKLASSDVSSESVTLAGHEVTKVSMTADGGSIEVVLIPNEEGDISSLVLGALTGEVSDDEKAQYEKVMASVSIK